MPLCEVVNLSTKTDIETCTDPNTNTHANSVAHSARVANSQELSKATNHGPEDSNMADEATDSEIV